MMKTKLIYSIVFFCFWFSGNAQNYSESENKYYSVSLEKNDSESIAKHYSINTGNSIPGKSAESIAKYFSIVSANSMSNISPAKYYKIGDLNIAQKPVSSISAAISNELSIPVINKTSKNTYALIIGNEDYKSFQQDLSSEQNVNFAINDSRLFKELCQKTLGIPADNIIYLENAGFIQMKKAIEQINLIGKLAKGKANILFYYAGHGLPDEKTKEPYIIPVDVSGNSLGYAIPLSELYSKLTEFSTEKTIVFLDACFTGGGRNSGLVATRGVKIKPKSSAISGNLVVLTSSSKTESSLPYKEKQHGLFTYFLISKIAESKGTITLLELENYLVETVPLKSVLFNKQVQSPKAYVSPIVIGKYINWKLSE